MINKFYELGRANALKLRENAANMNGTEIINNERDAAYFDPQKDYSGYSIGAPVRDDGQVWLLLQPHNASYYNGRPATLRSLWGLAHTTNPNKAKAWVAPYGTSGMYMKDECYKTKEGLVYRCKQDNTVHDAASYPNGWEMVS